MSFTELPGEIRNIIYEYSLISEDLICVDLHSDPKEARVHKGKECILPMSTHEIHRRGAGKKELRALQNLSLLNRTIREEARSFFFANNRFRATAVPPQSKFKTSPTMPLFNRFLTNIGEDGRANIASLICWSFEDTEPFPGLGPGRLFFTLLGQCKNLKMLSFPACVEYICLDNPTILYDFLRGRRQMATSAAATFLDTIEGLPNLRSLEITCRPSQASFALKADFNEWQREIVVYLSLRRVKIVDFAAGLEKLLRRRLECRGVDVAVRGFGFWPGPSDNRMFHLHIKPDGDVGMRPKGVLVLSRDQHFDMGRPMGQVVTLNPLG